MLSEAIVIALSTVTIVGWLLHLLFKHCYRKLAMRRLIWRYMRDSFMDEYDYMRAFRAMLSQAYMENAKEKFRK